jgi:gliding motility associated protien GldN
MRPLLIIFFSLSMCQQAYAQQPGKTLVSPPSIREADVVVSKRVWRVIDLNERNNKVAVWPRSNITKIIYNYLLNGSLQPYYSDSLKSVYNIEQLRTIGVDTTFAEVPIDPDDPEITKLDTIVSPFVPEERILQLLIMEEWYFDQRHGAERPQIIAIAPLYRLEVAGIDMGLRPLCWIKYFDRMQQEKDMRQVLAMHKVFNPSNDRVGLTFFDWFQQRRFHSVIVKESNMYDISIMEDPEVKRNGLEALFEAQKRDKQQQRNESDMYEH